MLTTSGEGLWALQVLTGIETIAPELGLRPILPSVESRQQALAHPIAAELRSAGVVDDGGVVDATVVEWLTVLARREVALVIHLLRPDGDAPARVVIARFARWWVVLERSGELIRISGAGTAGTEAAATAVLAAQLRRLCGSLPAAPLRPVTLDARAFHTAVADQQSLRAFLVSQRLDVDQVQTIMLAVDLAHSAQASIVAVQTGLPTGRPTRTQVGRSAVTVLDTPQGRIFVEQVVSAGKTWMIVSPGTETDIAAAVNRMLRRLPADQEWHSYRRVV